MTISATNGTLSSTGIGSGLDVSSIITQLMAAESQPLTLLQNAASSINTQISAVGQIHSLTSALGDKAQALESLDLWKGVTATSGDSSVVTADTSAGGASAGTYQVSVQALAQAQTVTSAPSTGLSAGKLMIELGTYTGSNPATQFDTKPGTKAIEVDIGDGDTSLASIRDKINAAGAGVQATVITDANGSRLSIRSTDTGAVNGFRITATETTDDGSDTTGLSTLGFDAMTTTSPMQLNQSAGNAKATVNGITLESATNTFTGVSDGLNLTVSKLSATPVNVTLAQDTTSMTNAINGFVSAYNSLNAYIHNETKYDAASKTGGPLQGDPSIVGFQYQLRGLVTGTTTASSTFQRLSDIGITVQADGSLAADSTKLAKAMTNVPEVKKLLANVSDDPGAQGVMVRFQQLTDNALTTGGRISSRETGLRAQLQRNSDSQTEMQTRLAATQQRYQTQFQALDTTMAKMTALSTYMTQQITLMQNSG